MIAKDSRIRTARGSLHRMVGLTPLVLPRAECQGPNWNSRDEILRSHLRRTGVYRARWGRRGTTSSRLHELSLRSSATNAVVDLRVPTWVMTALRAPPRGGELAHLLGSATAQRISLRSLRRYLYLPEILGAINLSRPNRT